MKNMTKIFLSIVLILILPAMIYGQELEKAVHIDVEGIEPGARITYSEFVSRFGKPDSYKKYESEFGLSERYTVGKNKFYCEENGILYNFRLHDNRFRALTTYMDGGVRVGDPFSKLDFLKPDLVRQYDDGSAQYVLFEKISDDKLIVFVKDSIILSMVFNYPL